MDWSDIGPIHNAKTIKEEIEKKISLTLKNENLTFNTYYSPIKIIGLYVRRHTPSFVKQSKLKENFGYGGKKLTMKLQSLPKKH